MPLSQPSTLLVLHHIAFPMRFKCCLSLSQVCISCGVRTHKSKSHAYIFWINSNKILPFAEALLRATNNIVISLDVSRFKMIKRDAPLQSTPLRLLASTTEKSFIFLSWGFMTRATIARRIATRLFAMLKTYLGHVLPSSVLPRGYLEALELWRRPPRAASFAFQYTFPFAKTHLIQTVR